MGPQLSWDMKLLQDMKLINRPTNQVESTSTRTLMKRVASMSGQVSNVSRQGRA